MLRIMDYKKTLVYVGGLFLAVGGPISMFSATDAVSGAKKSWFSGSTNAAAPAQPQPAAPTPAPATPSTPALTIGPIAAPADTTPTPSLADVLRFDVTVEWVLQRWPRVTTGLPHLQLQGYRVTLVTGTSTADVAGSLTYYFNSHQQVQRITLHGTTGDPSVLVGVATGRHHFARRLTNDPSVVLYEAVDTRNRPAGSLKIRSAPVVRIDKPYTRYEIDLSMDRVE